MKKKITKDYLNIIEGIGLILILLSFFIQIQEMEIESDIREVQYHNTQKKLDNIWTVLSKNYLDTHKDENGYMWIDFKSLNENFGHYSTDRSHLEKWKEIIFFSKIVGARIWFFVIGSFLLIIPKFVVNK